MRYSHGSDLALALGLIAAWAIWVFNAHRMGKFAKSADSDAASGSERKKYLILAIGGGLLVLAVSGLLLFGSNR